MPRVSLILPTIPGDPRPDATVPALRAALERAGHEVEVLVAFGPGADAAAGDGPGWRAVVARDRGRASSAMAGLEAASGAILIVLDPRMGDSAESLPGLVEPLARGEAELVVGSRLLRSAGAGPLGRLLGLVARTFTGSTDPLSGLVGLSRAALDRAAPSFGAVGANYGMELLGKVQGRRVDVPSRAPWPSRRDLPGWDDLRQLKRLADHRYGNRSRLIQFCAVGASGMVVDLTCYHIFQQVFARTPLARHVVAPTKVSFALALAGALAIAVALVWNFSLNRRLTFSYARRGSAPRQFAAYAASNFLGVMVSLAFRLLLPRKVAFFDQHKLAAAVVGIVAATGISFTMSRWVVFRKRPGDGKVAPTPREEPGPSLVAAEQAV